MNMKGGSSGERYSASPVNHLCRSISIGVDSKWHYWRPGKGLPASKSAGTGYGLPRREPRRGEAPRQSGAPVSIEPVCPIFLVPTRFDQWRDASRACRLGLPPCPKDESLVPASVAFSTHRVPTAIKSDPAASGFDFDPAP